jgi:hypothetical protein
MDRPVRRRAPRRATAASDAPRILSLVPRRVVPGARRPPDPLDDADRCRADDDGMAQSSPREDRA